ncbi:MAG: GH3 family domain-containing protein [Candidatus Helarchaeota archaeon]
MRFFELYGGLAARLFKYYTSLPLKNPLATQIALLREILKFHRSTLFGQRHHFETIRTVRQFQARCPPQSYEYFKPYIDLIFNGQKKALFNSHLVYFAQTAGTTGKPKLIPITFNTLTNYTFGILRTASYYISQNIHAHSAIISGKWLYLPAPPILRYRAGIPIGYITGLLMLPYSFQIWHYPLNYKCYAPLHLMHVQNVEEKFQRITKECLSKNITVLVGVTPVILNLLEYLLKYSKAQTISELFPNLEFAIFSGVPPKFYQARLTNLIGHPLKYREVYAASEGMLATQLSDHPSFTPLVDSVFFEFLPLHDSTERLLIHQVKKGEKYRVVITTHNGLYAYDLGDIVQFVSIDPPAFVFAFRKGVVDLTDEKLTPMQVFSAIDTANRKQNCSLADFCVIGTYHPKPHWIFVVEFQNKSPAPSYHAYLETLDTTLASLNNIYYQNREGANKGTLAPPELWVLQTQAFYLYEQQQIQEGRPAGQIKVPHLTKDSTLLEFFQSHTLQTISL